MGLQRLRVEWINRGEADYRDEQGRRISMRELEAELLRLKDAVSYKKNWQRLATRHYTRHAWNLEYIAALLYLVDERCLPVSDLQPTIHLQLGHLYRQLKRGGVVWRAHTKGLGARLREDYFPYDGVLYLDPLTNVLLRAGERVALPPDVEIYKSLLEENDQSGGREEILGLISGFDIKTPYPLLATKPKAARKPPSFPQRRSRAE